MTKLDAIDLKALAHAAAVHGVPWDRVRQMIDLAAFRALYARAVLETRHKLPAASRLIGIPTWVLRDAAKKGRIPVDRAGPKTWLIRYADLVEFAKHMRHQPSNTHKTNKTRLASVACGADSPEQQKAS